MSVYYTGVFGPRTRQTVCEVDDHVVRYGLLRDGQLVNLRNAHAATLRWYHGGRCSFRSLCMFLSGYTRRGQKPSKRPLPPNCS